MDVDGAYGPKTIRKVIEKIVKEDYDLSIASRWVNKSFKEVEGKFLRKIYSRMWFFWSNYLLD